MIMDGSNRKELKEAINAYVTYSKIGNVVEQKNAYNKMHDIYGKLPEDEKKEFRSVVERIRKHNDGGKGEIKVDWQGLNIVLVVIAVVSVIIMLLAVFFYGGEKEVEIGEIGNLTTETAFDGQLFIENGKIKGKYFSDVELEKVDHSITEQVQNMHQIPSMIMDYGGSTNSSYVHGVRIFNYNLDYPSAVGGVGTPVDLGLDDVPWADYPFGDNELMTYFNKARNKDLAWQIYGYMGQYFITKDSVLLEEINRSIDIFIENITLGVNYCYHNYQDCDKSGTLRDLCNPRNDSNIKNYPNNQCKECSINLSNLDPRDFALYLGGDDNALAHYSYIQVYQASKLVNNNKLNQLLPKITTCLRYVTPTSSPMLLGVLVRERYLFKEFNVGFYPQLDELYPQIGIHSVHYDNFSGDYFTDMELEFYFLRRMAKTEISWRDDNFANKIDTGLCWWGLAEIEAYEDYNELGNHNIKYILSILDELNMSTRDRNILSARLLPCVDFLNNLYLSDNPGIDEEMRNKSLSLLKLYTRYLRTYYYFNVGMTGSSRNNRDLKYYALLDRPVYDIDEKGPVDAIYYNSVSTDTNGYATYLFGKLYLEGIINE